MIMNIALEPILSIVVGILILLVPRFLNYFVAVYLIVVGNLGLTHPTLKAFTVLGVETLKEK